MNCKQLITESNKALESISGDVNRPLIIENVSVNKTLSLTSKYSNHSYYDGNTTIGSNNYKISLKIRKSAIKKATKRYGELVPATYNFMTSDISISGYGQLTAEIVDIEKSGVNEREMINQQLYKFAKKHRMLKRRKKSLPKKVESILCLTSKGSDIKSDIVANTGLSERRTYVYNCYSSQILADKIMTARNVDVIVLYRGGHEDHSMDMFSKEEVLMAISNSKIPVCVALGHEEDKPFVYKIADLTYSTPSAFGKAIYKHNSDKTKNRLIKLLVVAWLVTMAIYLL